MPQVPPDLPHDPFFAALTKRAAREAESRLARTAGTHALLLDAIDGPAPEAAGLGRWTALRLDPDCAFAGPLRASPEALPFCDNSFGAVMIRHLAGAGMTPKAVVGEAARVLAPHGLLLVIECHPVSGWRPWWAGRKRHGQFFLRGVSPRCWKSALLQAGLLAGEPSRCGAAWPRARDMPRWLERVCGDVWLLSARKHDDGMIVQRAQHKRARGVAEQTSWMPGAHRQRS